MIGILIGVAVIALTCALVLVYWRVLKLTFPEKLATDEVYMVTTRDLWRIRVCRYRKGRTNGQPVLLVHGANVNQHTFTSPKGANLVEHLVERGFDCWTVDLRGGHASEAPFERHRNQVTIDDYLNDDIPTAIRFVQQETGYAKIHYCGQSLGGMLLYAYVLKFGAESIASAVTLGSPIGFDGVKLGRSSLTAGLIKASPALAGAIARGLIPFVFLLRISLRAFPMNMRNIARGMNTGSFYTMLEDPLPGVLRQLMKWVHTPGWRMDGGQLDVQEGLKTLDVPLFAIFAPLDPFVPLDTAKAFFEALPTEDKRLLIASKELGCKRDYNHCDLAFGLEGPREIFGPIARWFEAHSTREQIAAPDTLAISGYQAPLRASERADILSGGSFAHLSSTPVPSAPVSEVLPEPPAPVRKPIATTEPLTTTETVAKSEPGATTESLTTTETVSKLEPMATTEPPTTTEPFAKVEPFATPEPTAKTKPPAKKKSTAKKKAVAKKPAAAKKPATKKPAAAKSSKSPVKKAAAKKPAAKPLAEKSPATPTTRTARPQSPDLASVSAALSALRPAAPKAQAASAPIRVKASDTAPLPAKDAPVETPKSVLKALSNASDAMESFKRSEGKKDA